MNLTQQKIYHYLQKHPTTTAQELSSFLGMTPANIRHHLARMVQDGVVEVIVQKPEGRGRPTYRYALAPQAQANNLNALANALLLELLAQLPPNNQPDIYKSLAARLCTILTAGSSLPSPGLHLTRRLTKVVQILNTCHYEARWEAHAAAPRLMLYHCPYAAILAQHPELCLVDAFLLEKLLGTPVIQTARQGSGSTACVFQVG